MFDKQVVTAQGAPTLNSFWVVNNYAKYGCYPYFTLIHTMLDKPLIINKPLNLKYF